MQQVQFNISCVCVYFLGWIERAANVFRFWLLCQIEMLCLWLCLLFTGVFDVPECATGDDVGVSGEAARTDFVSCLLVSL